MGGTLSLISFPIVAKNMLNLFAISVTFLIVVLLCLKHVGSVLFYLFLFMTECNSDQVFFMS